MDLEADKRIHCSKLKQRGIYYRFEKLTGFLLRGRHQPSLSTAHPGWAWRNTQPHSGIFLEKTPQLPAVGIYGTRDCAPELPTQMQPAEPNASAMVFSCKITCNCCLVWLLLPTCYRTLYLFFFVWNLEHLDSSCKGIWDFFLPPLSLYSTRSHTR